MTKFEWERELKKNLHALSDEERQRVLDYYDELFMDKIERGETERSIIAEFGNPFDVANKILSEQTEANVSQAQTIPSYARIDDEITSQAQVVRCKDEAQSSDKKKHDGPVILRLIVLVVAWLIAGSVLACVAAGLAAGAVGLVAGSGAMVLGGIAGAVVACTQFATNVWSSLAELGICVAVSGLGLILLPLCIKLLAAFGKLAVKLCKKLVCWISGKKEAADEN